ncbi:MAG: hypothetical protein U5K37_12065 [Natrialbaceae archaeon]|nr:hypothetical protein [Natrialbaceae archaeon]
MTAIGLGAIQFPLDTEAVGNRQQYEDRIETLVESAIEELEDGPCIIALPEYLGLFPLLFGKQELLADTDSLKGAMAGYVSDQFKSISWLRVRRQVSWGRAILLEGQDRIADFYFSVFPELARRYDTYIVGGTAPLAPATVEDHVPDGVPGRSAAGGKGTVHSVSVLFDPTGEPRLVSRKVELTDLEDADKLDLVAADADTLETAETDVGTVGIGIGLDPFKQAPRSALERVEPEILVQPTSNPADWRDRSVQERWCEDVLGARRSLGVAYGVTPMLAGSLLDMPFSGQSSITGPDGPGEIGYRDLEPHEEFLAVATDYTGGAVATANVPHPTK